MINLFRLQRGVGLIEVMVAVLLLGTSLLAISSLQMRSLQQNHESLLRTQANILAYDILERVRMASPMAPSALVLPDQAVITNLAQNTLPNGAANLNCDIGRLCVITLTWDEFARSDDLADQQPSIFTYSTRL